MHYEETLSNDFVLDGGTGKIELLQRDMAEWQITFVDTGAASSIGERLRTVRPYLKAEEMFLANYSDGVTDLDLNRYIADVRARDKIASFLCVRPNLSLHAVSASEEGQVQRIEPITEAGVWINGGFFVLRQEIFEYLGSGEDLVVDAFNRLIPRAQLLAYKYNGFWAAMDTFKDRDRLEELWTRGNAPWCCW